MTITWIGHKIPQHLLKIVEQTNAKEDKKIILLYLPCLIEIPLLQYLNNGGRHD